MKLVIEKIDGEIYMSRVSEARFKKIYKGYESTITLDDLDKDCAMHKYPDFRFIVDMKHEPREWSIKKGKK